jgi:hypothetical protein
MTTSLRVDMAPFVADLVGPTVADVHRRYGDDVPLDDLMQEAAVWWYGPGQKYLPEYLTEDEKYVRLRRSIWRFIARFAEREKAHAIGYEPIDQVHYHPQEIIADPARRPRPRRAARRRRDHDGPKPKGNLAEGGDVLAMLVDVRRAIHALDFEDQTFLVLAADLANDWDRIAANTGTLPDSARRRQARIAERMARWLNNEED